MEQIIQQLVDARKNKGISLEELHSLTKIPLSQLEALEQIQLCQNRRRGLFAWLYPTLRKRGGIRWRSAAGYPGPSSSGSSQQGCKDAEAQGE